VDALLGVSGNHTCADCATGGMSLAGSGKKQRPLWAWPLPFDTPTNVSKQ